MTTITTTITLTRPVIVSVMGHVTECEQDFTCTVSAEVEDIDGELTVIWTDLAAIEALELDCEEMLGAVEAIEYQYDRSVIRGATKALDEIAESRRVA